MDSPASDTPRQSLLAFLGRPSRPRTQAPPPQHPQSQAQPSSQTQAQGNSNANDQSQQSQQQHSQSAHLAAALSQFLPQSPIIPSRRQTIPVPPVTSSNNNNTSAAQPSPASPAMQTGSFGNMLRRRRSANNVERSDTNRRVHVQPNNNPTNTNNSTSNNNASANSANANTNSAGGGGGGNMTNVTGGNHAPNGGGGTGPTHRIRLVPHLDSVRSLTFEPISRDVRQGDQPLRIGRFTDHSSTPGQVSNKLAFKSKVVSRGHAEVWFDNGSFFIKDTKSSSGTFLNHIRLSPPNSESRPFPIKDGDVLQLGVDYQGGTEEMYRCVRIRIELGREWQTSVNAYNLQAFQQLKNLANPGAGTPPLPLQNGEGSSSSRPGPGQGRTTPRPADQSQSNPPPLKPPVRQSSRAVRPKAASKQAIQSSASAPAANNNNSGGSGGGAVSDCCICLSSVTICQALFIAPCSHAYHYKCIRPLLQMHHPGFSCPLCRTFADLEADVEGGELMFGFGGVGVGVGGIDDQMVVDGDEGYEQDDNGVVEDGEGENESGGGGGGVGQSNHQSGQAGHQLQQQQQQSRLSQTPEAGAEVDGDGDAGAETDTMPEMMGPMGMGGFASSIRSPVEGGESSTRSAAAENGNGDGGGLIHDPTVDVDPSVPGGVQQQHRSRLPLHEEEEEEEEAEEEAQEENYGGFTELNSDPNIRPMFGAGPLSVRLDFGVGAGVGVGLGLGPPLIIEDGDGTGAGAGAGAGEDGVGELGTLLPAGSNAAGSANGGGPLSVATLVNKRR